MLLSYVPLACLSSVLLTYHAALSCTFIAHLVLHLYKHNLTCLHLQLGPSNLTSTYKSCTFYCISHFQLQFYICPYILHLKSFVNQSYTLQPVMRLLFVHLICNASLSYTFVESNVLKFCLAILSNPMSCTFVLHFWLAPLDLISILVPLFCFLCCTFCALFSCTFVLYFDSHCLALQTLITSITSLASFPCSWNPFVLHLELVCLLYVLQHQLLSLSLVLQLCLATLSCIFDLLYLAQSTPMSAIISCIFVLFLCPALPSPFLLLWFACFKPTFNAFHHYLIIPLNLVICLVPCLAPFLVPLNAELQCLRYTQYGLCVESWCQNAYALLSCLCDYLSWRKCSTNAYTILSTVFVYNHDVKMLTLYSVWSLCTICGGSHCIRYTQSLCRIMMWKCLQYSVVYYLLVYY